MGFIGFFREFSSFFIHLPMDFPTKTASARVERWDAELAAQQGKRQLLLAELSASEDQQALVENGMGGGTT